jgi:Ca2+/Na+ antiporter
VAVVSLASISGAVAPGVGLALCFVVFGPYVAVLAMRRRHLDRVRIPERWASWVDRAVVEEELELEDAIRPTRGRPVDTLVAVASLVVVVLASIVMERSATTLGVHFAIPGLIVGGVILAAVTSLPNAVAAIYLAARGRGAAMLSTALNSNSLNVLLGLLLPAVIVGLARPTGAATLVGSWYVGLTVVTLVLAYVGRGLRRWAGCLIVALYLAFVAVLFAIT